MKTVKLLLSSLLILLTLYSFGENTENFKTSEFRFTENKGQIVDFNQHVRNEFLFYTKTANLDIYFRKNGITYIFKKSDKIPDNINISKEEYLKLVKEFLNKKTLYYRLDVDFINPDNQILITGNNSSKFTSNFYYAHCPNGILNVKSFKKIKYTNVYPNIDFEFYYKNNQFKYDVILHTGADINNIKLKFNGAKNIILKNNEININSPVGNIIENLPKSYFLDNKNKKINTNIKYQINNNIVNFISKQKITTQLVIDPQISWTTYYDDCFWNGSGSSIDVKGNQVIITSYGYNNDFPTLNPGGSAYFQNSTSGSSDYRILQFDSDGVRQWATYYGGTSGDYYADVKIDYSGNIFVAGHTESSDIPTQNAGGYYDATYNAATYGGGIFILKFNSSGVRQWGTHYDYVAYPQVDIDHNNNIYVLGRSEYDNPPVLSLSGAYNQATVSPDGGGSNASADIFIIKFNSSTSRVWATNLGSTSDEFLVDIYISSDNYLNILGDGDNYSGTGIITANPGGGAYYDNTLGIGTGGSSTDREDALIYRFTPSGSLFWGTAFSGTLAENVQQGRITADASNNIYILGETRSTDLPFTDLGNGAYFDNTFNSYGSNSFNPFIAGFSSGGVLNWCTYLGSYGLGFGMNFSHYIGFNNNDNLILVSTDGGGVGGSKPLIPRTGDYNATLQVYMGVYIAEFNSNFDINWSTYYAGTTNRHSLGDCALSSNSCGYELYMTTNWEKYDSAATDPPWVKPIPASYQDISWLTTGSKSGLITRFSNVNSVAPTSITATPAAICPGDSTMLTINGGSLGSGASWQWYTGSCGGTNFASGDSIYVNPTTATTYYVRAEGTCNVTTCQSITVNINEISTDPDSIYYSQSYICPGDSVTLTVAGGSLGTGASWDWFTSPCGMTGVPIASGNSITVSPTDTTTYYVWATGACNSTICVNTTITAGTLSTDPTSATASNSNICEGSPTTLFVSGGSLGSGADWIWYKDGCGQGTSIGSGDSLQINPTSTTVYYVRAEGGCDTTNCETVVINVTQSPNAGSDTSLSVCFGDASFDMFTMLQGNPSGGGLWTDSSGNTLSNSIFNPQNMSSGTFLYTVAGTGPCADAISNVNITVNQLPNVNFSGLDTAYCFGVDAINLKGNNAPNGTFFGTNISDNGDGTADFNPVTEGTQTIIYQYTDSNNCSAADTQSVVVYSAVKIDTSIISNISCSGNSDGSILVNISGGTPSYTYQWTGPSNFTSTSNQIVNLFSGNYNLTVTDKNNCKSTITYTLTEGTDACLDIPTVFTPNGDGVNDDWQIDGVSAINNIHIEIYNRWGDLIFSFDGSGSEYDSNRWDGTYNGKELPISSYVFIIDIKNGKDPIQGIVTIKK